jgi:Plasmid encoded RepA protein.
MGKQPKKYQGKYSNKPIENKIVTSAVEIRTNLAQIENAMFQHSVLCQAFLPYRNPGDDISIWKRKQGNASLIIQCLQKEHPESGDFVTIGLPYGTKARLILAFINSQSIITQNPRVDVTDSMTAFIERIGIANTGRNIKEVKNQLARIASSVLSLTYKVSDTRTLNADFKLIKTYDLWFPKNKQQRVLWNSEIELTQEYFGSLMEHAIPLDERALAALSHNAMALDTYMWLAQRLHRVKDIQFITWKAMKDQFGEGYARMADFKKQFRKVLTIVKLVYRDAKIAEVKNKGFQLLNSPSPVPKQKTHHFLEMPKK